MNYEKNIYELAKQDREEVDKNLVLGKSDLAKLFGKKGDAGEGGEEDGEERKDGDDIDEELLLEMCKFSNMSTANNLKKASGNGMIERRNGNLMQGGL